MSEQIQTKRYTFKFIGDIADDGSFKAAFAKLNEKDKHGDITIPGAFGRQNVIIGSYNHGSWGSGVTALPVGKGVIYEGEINGELWGICEGKFFLTTQAGLETYKTVKEVGDMQEWSYSLPEIDFEIRQDNGERARILKKIGVNEVAPVLMGAGNDTHTMAIKSHKQSLPINQHFETVQAAVKELVDRIKSLGELREADGRHPSEATLKSVALFKSQLTDFIRELDSVQVKHDLVYGELIAFEKLNFDIGGNNA
jgi:hypothetical protein